MNEVAIKPVRCRGDDSNVIECGRPFGHRPMTRRRRPRRSWYQPF